MTIFITEPKLDGINNKYNRNEQVLEHRQILTNKIEIYTTTNYSH
jgi:hypothetical protein